VNGGWFRAAGAGKQCAPAARLMGASVRSLNFTARRDIARATSKGVTLALRRSPSPDEE